MTLLVRHGGDVRLHHDDGRSVKDFVLLLDKPETRRDMLEFIENIHLMTLLQAFKSQQTSICPSLAASVQNEQNPNDIPHVIFFFICGEFFQINIQVPNI
jgi:hypothetical protein